MFLIFLLAVRMSSASSPFPTPQQNAESSKKKKKPVSMQERQILEEDYLDTIRASGEYLNVRDVS